jgi:hypothetical protein
VFCKPSFDARTVKGLSDAGKTCSTTSANEINISIPARPSLQMAE